MIRKVTPGRITLVFDKDGNATGIMQIKEEMWVGEDGEVIVTPRPLPATALTLPELITLLIDEDRNPLTPPSEAAVSLLGRVQAFFLGSK